MAKASLSRSSSRDRPGGRAAWRDSNAIVNHREVSGLERDIIAYLLAHNQKIFTCAADGGYAVTLISRGIVIHATQPGHRYASEDVPMAIPDNVWKVLLRHRGYAPPPKGETEPHPWRVPWSLRS
jgi:hypothetical protein